MEKIEYKYDAFISYRHCDPDQFVAKTLHKQLESYKLPGNVIRKLKKNDPDAKTRIKRVFRDQEELPLATNLADPIVDAIKNSEWLIVICSPRLKESMWCKKEIETFISIHGIEKVLAVLVEGEPDEAFPDELLYRDIEVKRYNGSFETIRESIEPLAADARGKNNSERTKMIKNDVARLIAPMFGVEYDELKQRHKERRMRTVLAGVTVAAIVCFMFGVLSAISAFTISKKNEEIQAQSDALGEQALQIVSQNEALKANQARNLAADSNELLEKDDRRGAVLKAYESLTEYEGMNMPYTDEGMNALVKSLRPYDATGAAVPQYSIKTDGIISMTNMSPKRTVLFIYDSTRTAYFWSVDAQKLISKVSLEGSLFEEDDLIFIDEQTVVYNDNGIYYKYDIVTGEKEVIYEDGFLMDTIYSYDSENRIFYYRARGDVSDIFKGINIDTNEVRFEYELENFEGFCSAPVTVMDGYVAMGVYEGNDTTLRILDMDGNLVRNIPLGDEVLRYAYIMDGRVYIISDRQKTMEEDGVFALMTGLRAVDINSGNLLWHNEYQSAFSKKLYSIESDGVKSIVAIGSSEIIEVEPDTGKELARIHESNDILSYGHTDNAVIYLTSSPIQMFFMIHTTFGFKSSIESNQTNFGFGEMTSEGFFLAKPSSNKITYYGKCENADIEGYAGECPENNTKVYSNIDEEFEEIVEQYNIQNIQLVERIAIDEDEEYLCITYRNYTCEIYNAETMDMICTFDVFGSRGIISEYLGKDNNGNMYWANEDTGYCISPSGTVVAEIPCLRAVELDENVYILGLLSSEDRYCVPIYSLDELLTMAEDYLERTDVSL